MKARNRKMHLNNDPRKNFRVTVSTPILGKNKGTPCQGRHAQPKKHSLPLYAATYIYYISRYPSYLSPSLCIYSINPLILEFHSYYTNYHAPHDTRTHTDYIVTFLPSIRSIIIIHHPTSMFHHDKNTLVLPPSFSLILLPSSSFSFLSFLLSSSTRTWPFHPRRRIFGSRSF